MGNKTEYKSNNNNIFYSCKAQHQRDVNAAINIHRVGTSTLRGETVRAASVA